MKITQGIGNALNSITNAGKRIFPSQHSDTFDPTHLLDTLSEFSGMRFQNIGDFISYYKNSYFKTAYLNLNPFTCAQLATSNVWISSAINAIADPISNADIIGIAKDLQHPNELEIEYLENLINHPNPLQPENVFAKMIATDYKQCGSAYIEVTYNMFGWPARLDRIAPSHIKAKKVNNKIFFINQNGYVFPDNGIIPIFDPNPFDDSKGLTPLVGLFNHLMLDEAVVEHNLRYFTSDMLKGVLSFDKTIPYEIAKKEVDRVGRQIKSLEEEGKNGNIAIFGATYELLSSTNSDMLTPSITQNIIDAVKASYHVPQSKIGFSNGGSIGNGEGENQDDMMNDTLNNNMNMILSHLNFRLLEFAGIEDTILGFRNLTKTDQVRQGELDTQAWENGSRTWNEIRTARGDDPYPEDFEGLGVGDQPWLLDKMSPANLLTSPSQPATPIKQSINDAMKNELCREGVQQASLTPRKKQKQSLLEQNVQKLLEENGLIEVL